MATPQRKTDLKPRPASIPSDKWIGADDFNGLIDYIGEAALVAVQVFANTAAGLAAVAEGAFFNVPSAGSTESLILYKKTGGLAVEQKRSPSSSAVTTLVDELGTVSASKNLYNLKTRIPQTSINSGTGALQANVLWSTSQLIPVLPGTQYVANKGGWLLAQYRADGTFISRIDYQAPAVGDRVFTTDANAASIRAQVDNTVKSFQIELAGASTAYEPYGYTAAQLRADAGARRAVTATVTSRDGNGRLLTMTETGSGVAITTTIVRTGAVVTRVEVDDGVFIEKTTINRDGGGKFTGTTKTIEEK